MSLQPIFTCGCCTAAARLLHFATTQPYATEISYSGLAPDQGFEP